MTPDPRPRAQPEVSRREPIAVVGMGCRFPGGVVDAASLWRLLLEGKDAVGDVPSERWDHSIFHHPDPTRPRSTTAAQAGFIEGVDLFDAGFFGISPREAAQMDPQHRVLLEVSWEALEDAGMDLERLRGSPTAVFMGISAREYPLLQTIDTIDTHASTGQASCMAANRISHAFHLLGPSVAVDTACSSSLVAVHMACSSIWSGEATVALAGGVNVLLGPDTFVGFSGLSMLSPDSRCFAFDARANGFVRSEGAGVVVLKPLSRARRDGDVVHAVILATVVNQDGHTPGITVPSESSQEGMLQAAYAAAGVKAGDVAYVEAHGTGTQVGDVVEAAAIGRCLGQPRRARGPLLLGSVKTNVGHLEAAAGMVGLIKACLVARHGVVPPNLHFERPNPRIDFDALNVRVPVEATPLPGGGSIVLGVNSFGFGGTNAHVVLAPPPERPEPTGTNAGSPPFLLPVSARSPEALVEAARAFGETLGGVGDQGGPALGDVCHAAAVRRTHHPFRLVAVGDGVAELRSALDAYVQGGESPGLVHGRAPSSTRRPRLAFLFPGQGSQWWGMGRELLDGDAAFRGVVERCDVVVRDAAGWSLLDEFRAAEDRSRIAETSVAQPMLFAVQAGLVESWRSRGVVPDLVLGHSVGEIAAAYAAGILGLEEAAHVAVHRGRLMDRAGARGRMLAVGADPATVEPYLAGHEAKVSLAAVNSPTAVTISGDAESLEKVRRALRRGRVASTYLDVGYAFHSPQMDPVREELLQALAFLEPRPARVPIVSSVTGRMAEGADWDAGYWWRNLRQAVRFAPAVDTLLDEGVDVFLELGPQPTLVGSVKDCLTHAGAGAAVLSPLRRDKGGPAHLLAALARLHVLGVGVDWSSVYPGGREVKLPRYPWQRERYWVEDERRRREISVAPVHPLLGVEQIASQPTWLGRLDPRALGYLEDHALQGAPVVPAAAYLEMALAVAREVMPGDTVELEGVSFEAPCFVPDSGKAVLETRYDPDGARIEISGRSRPGAPWTRHAHGRLVDAAGIRPRPAEGPDALRRRLPERMDAEGIYERFKAVGLDYGPAFRGILDTWRIDGEALGQVALPGGDAPGGHGHLLHPALLDACFQVTLAALPVPSRSGRAQGAYLPVSVERLRLHAPPPPRAWSHVRLREASRDALTADIVILDDDGRVHAEVTGFRCNAVAGGAEGASALDDLLFVTRWVPQALPTPASGEPGGGGARGSWLLLADGKGVAARLCARLEAEGHRVTVAVRAGCSVDALEGALVVDPLEPGPMQALLRQAVEKGPPLTHVVHLWGVDDAGVDSATVPGLEESEARGAGALLHLVQALARSGSATAPRLWVVTHRAQPWGLAEGEPVAVAQAPSWGFRRVAAFEHPALRPSVVDLGDPASEAELDGLVAEMLADLPEDEVVLRSRERAVHRYVRTSLGACVPEPVRAVDPRAQPFRATSSRLGSLDNLRLTAFTPSPPGPGEVQISVRAAGLNFADVLKALGLYPGVTTASATFGAECAGVVTAVGPRPEGGPGAALPRLEVGQRVVALAPDSFGSVVTAPAPYVLPVPDDLGWEEAAAIPIAFLTAHQALVGVAGLKAGERVLIHAATGGVGLAALQLARTLGAEVLATAGSDEKRAYLRSLGVRHVFDSRTLAFADGVMEATGGEGVDVVLNSLAGEAIAKGLSVLRPFGRFVEIGKRDVHGNARLGLRPLRDNVTFSVLDLDQAIRLDPPRVHDVFRRVMAAFADGTLAPLPMRAFPVTGLVDAFRHMSKAQHMGKIVVTHQVPRVPVSFPDPRPPVRADGTYLITGGGAGFGGTLARWMAAQGARHIVLASRSGAAARGVADLAAELGGEGVEVVAMAADVADPDQVAAILRRVREAMPPLRGVVHAAMVLDDGVISRLDATRLAAVTRPKVLGAWNLHTQTLDDPLDFFVMTSSVSSILGSPGQASYAAANAFLDSLAHHRRDLGLPALTLNLGAFDGVGHVSRNPEILAYLANVGIPPIPPEEVLAALERLLAGGEPQVGVVRFDLGRLAAGLMRSLVPPRFTELLSATAAAARGGGARHLRRTLAAAPAQEREGLLLTSLSEEMSRVLGVAANQFDPHLPLGDLGFDSLMTVELVLWIEENLDLKLPTVELMANPTTAELTRRLVELLEGGARSGSAAGDADGAELRADALLEAEIAPASSLAPRSAPDEVLVTGATGFVGAHLLAELLGGTGARVHCLVRAGGEEEGFGRIRQALEAYGLWDDGWASRVVPVPGDLAAEGLGLAADRFTDLAGSVGAVYHAGAQVNFLSPYPALRRTNVQGTREVLRLACAGAAKTFHHVSSIAVFPPAGHRDTITEDALPRDVEGLPDGYSQSKWVAEQLVLGAVRQGLAARIYRPGILAGHSATGIVSLNDAVLQVFLAGCRVGALPDLPVRLDVVPVDVAARAIVRISRSPAQHRIFHLANPEPIPLPDLLPWLEDEGLQLESLSYGVWRERMREHAAAHRFEHLLALLPEGEAEAVARLGGPARRFAADHTLSALEGTGVELAPLRREDVSLYVAYLRERGLLPGTAGVPASLGSPVEAR